MFCLFFASGNRSSAPLPEIFIRGAQYGISPQFGAHPRSTESTTTFESTRVFPARTVILPLRMSKASRSTPPTIGPISRLRTASSSVQSIPRILNSSNWSDLVMPTAFAELEARPSSSLSVLAADLCRPVLFEYVSELCKRDEVALAIAYGEVPDCLDTRALRFFEPHLHYKPLVSLNYLPHHLDSISSKSIVFAA